MRFGFAPIGEFKSPSLCQIKAPFPLIREGAFLISKGALVAVRARAPCAWLQVCEAGTLNMLWLDPVRGLVECHRWPNGRAASLRLVHRSTHLAKGVQDSLPGGAQAVTVVR
jgi:hypothetical protein